MAVKKIKLNRRLMTGDTISFDIALSEQFTPVDQSDVIEKNFVKTGVKESINEVIDYERIKYSPVDASDDTVTNVTYSLELLSGSTYGEVGFVNDDLLYRHNNLKESFLRLSFYDNDEPNNLNKLFELTIYPEYVNPYLDLESENLDFTVSDMIQNPSGFSEGYLIYYNKILKEVSGKTIYMKADFNNAKTGKVHRLMVKNTPGLDPEDIISHLFTKYQLKKDALNMGLYFVDDTYSNNITYNSTGLEIKLYEVELV